MQLSNLRVVITGATGGIGSALAQRLSEAGAQVIALGRNQERLEQLGKQLKANAAHPHQLMCVDLSQADAHKDIARQLAQLTPAPNALINLAGVGEFALFEQQTSTSIQQLVNLNITSTLLLVQALLPLFRRQSEAVTIVNVGSILGSIGYPGYVTYGCTKAAIKGFSEALSRELADTHIQVKYFAPRATATEFNSANSQTLNDVLGNTTDTTDKVARALVGFLSTSKPSCYLGWPEKLFVTLNALLPSVVGQSIRKQLSTIKALADRHILGDQP